MKVARYATGRSGVVAFDHGFHGRTLLGMSLTGKAMPYKKGFGPFAPEVYRAPYSDPFRGTGTLAETIDVLETMVGASSIACVVVEPIAGEGGFVVPEPGLARRTGAVVSRPTASCSWPTRSSPASAGPAPGSRASTRASCPTS